MKPMVSMKSMKFSRIFFEISVKAPPVRSRPSRIQYESQ
jgi:hypothetical protein